MSAWSVFHKACQPQQSSLVWQETSAKRLSSQSHGSVLCEDITSKEQGTDEIKKRYKTNGSILTKFFLEAWESFITVCMFLDFHFHWLVHLWPAAETASRSAKTPWEKTVPSRFLTIQWYPPEETSWFPWNFQLRPACVTRLFVAQAKDDVEHNPLQGKENFGAISPIFWVAIKVTGHLCFWVQLIIGGWVTSRHGTLRTDCWLLNINKSIFFPPLLFRVRGQKIALALKALIQAC